MSSAENRLALRIPCALPVRLAARGRSYAGTICDVSRTGLRLSLRARELGTEEDGLLVLAQVVGERLGQQFEGDLHYEMLGPLVRKRLRLVRLGRGASEQSVELGCVFDVPLSDDETTMIGLGLPPVGVTAVDAYQDVPRPRRRSEAADSEAPAPKPKAFDAYVHPSAGHAAEPLAGATSGMNPDGATVEVPVPPALAAPDLPSLAVGLAKAYGPLPTLEILDGLRMLWTGRVDIQRVETTEDERLLLHMEGVN